MLCCLLFDGFYLLVICLLCIEVCLGCLGFTVVFWMLFDCFLCMLIVGLFDVGFLFVLIFFWFVFVVVSLLFVLTYSACCFAWLFVDVGF